MASIAVTAISTAVSMYAQYQGQKAQEKSQKAAAEYNAQVAANEAATQQQLAQNEIAKGVADRERQQRQAARAMGEMRADMAAGGFEMDSGSNLSLLAESAAEHQYDSAVITSNAEQAAWQHEVSALNATNQGHLADWQYANAGSGRGAALLGMGGTLLGGIGSAIGSYGQWSQVTPAGGTGDIINGNTIQLRHPSGRLSNPIAYP
ncbi:MAG: hypothetical protein LBM64_04415 [Deltaproteobacteria bacterium]|nr:hypothetical protein [Deltaproteobacteria bacterium]